MSNVAENNKRIAKNTLALYVRMFFTMALGLYTSRVVLNVLGVDDYGIYGVVGGVVPMFAFINNSMAGSTQRFLTYEIGKGVSGRVKDVFNSSIFIHAIIALIVLVVAETVGLWFLEVKMIIPENRMEAARWLYQFTVLFSVISIMCVPFNALIISYEKMSVFAYISIADAVLRLIILFLLPLFDFDRLILYALLMLIVQLGVLFAYVSYSRCKFKEARLGFYYDKQLLKSIISFAGWSIYGNMAFVSFSQGLNLLLNTFFGAAVNAARSFAVQVQSAVQLFVTGFQTALNPQIVKYYAEGNLRQMHELIYTSSRFSFYLLYLLSLPVIIEAEPLLELWLGDVPEYTVVFVQIMLCVSLVDSISNPLIIAANATGKIKVYQLVIGGLLLLILPISYLVLKLGGEPWTVFIVHLLMVIVAQAVRLYLIRSMIELSIKEYLVKVLFGIVLVVLLSLPLPLLLNSLLPNGLIALIILIPFTILSTIVIVYMCGLGKGEKEFLTSKIKAFFK